MENRFFAIYCFKDEGRPKLGVNCWIGEDYYYSIPEYAILHNENRKRFFVLEFFAFEYIVRLKINIKTVGYTYYGRNMKKSLDKTNRLL